jgi:cytochrome c-type biogenesis protein
VIADGRLEHAFAAGLLVAINPCGFVLLPTYLLYFLGMENLRPGAERASVRRALLVSAAVTTGFMVVFIVVGAITKWGSAWLLGKSEWASLVVGMLLVVLGIAMLAGYRLPFTTPRLDVTTDSRGVRSMFVFGIAYAIASLGCALPIFVTVLGAFRTDGWLTGVSAVGMYVLAMGLLVSALTVSLAVANTAVLGALRRGMTWFEYLAGAFVLLTGLYLSWYWFNALSDRYDDGVITQAESWQARLSRFVTDHQTAIVTLAVIVVVGAVALSLSARTRRAGH